jgi:5-methylcytosine-specific restriction endonuclease McrA
VKAPSRPCCKPSCHRLARDRSPYCDLHQNSYDTHIRGIAPALRLAAQIRSSQRWRAVREVYRNTNPLCCNPLGLHIGPEPMNSVHHILGLLTHPELAYNESNLASLCDACHNQIEALERKGEPTQHLFKRP